MPLKLSLKPGEKFVLNGAVLTNGDKRTSLVIQNKACVLREKDIMQVEDADTPARRIYFPIMMMYLDPDDRRDLLQPVRVAHDRIHAGDQRPKSAGFVRGYQQGRNERVVLQGPGSMQDVVRFRTGAADLCL